VVTDQKRRFKAVIGDKEYTIIGPGSVAQFETVTALLNERLAAIQAADPHMTTESAAVLLAFNALSELVAAQAAAQAPEAPHA
jgi:cell division protein ZapA